MIYQIIVACLLVLSINPASAQGQKCETKEMTVELKVSGSRGLGSRSSHCVRQQVAPIRFCAPTGYAIKSFHWVDVIRRNVLGHEALSKLDDSCVAGDLRGYSSDHVGYAPFYRCSAVTWIKRLTVEYCASNT